MAPPHRVPTDGRELTLILVLIKNIRIIGGQREVSY
jgi:hypothetical protein